MINSKKGIKIIKKFKDDSLSKVYLIQLGKKNYIRKIIPIDFINEFYKQRYLARRCKFIQVPKIYSIKKEGINASALMEFLPHSKRSIKLSETLYVLSKFHNETEGIRSGYFERYNFDRFYNDFVLAKKDITSSLKNMTKTQLKSLFGDVFNSKYSVVHGDFHKGQIFKNDRYCILDFPSSFYGPRILDYAYLFRHRKNVSLNLLKKNTELSPKDLVLKFTKSLIVILIYDISWLINRRKYENNLFDIEILKNNKLIEYNLKKIHKLVG